MYSTVYMAFLRQPLLFTETPNNAYETVEGTYLKINNQPVKL